MKNHSVKSDNAALLRYKAEKLLEEKQTENSVWLTEADKENALAAGCNDYIVKPIITIELQKMIITHVPDFVIGRNA